MRTGRTRYGADVLRVPALRKDGQRISIAFTVALLQADGRVTGIAAIVRDETSRWEEEQQMQRRLAELEGRRSRAEDDRSAL
jgi:hypothetical protein